MEDISNLVDSMGGICIAIGDFDAVKSRSEREGSQFDGNGLSCAKMRSVRSPYENKL